MSILSGCDAREKAAPGIEPPASAGLILPAAAEGVFTIAVEEGDVQGDIENNFGTLTVGSMGYVVEMNGSAARSARISGAEVFSQGKWCAQSWAPKASLPRKAS
ncbi:MAG TPA: hypothetical protein VEC06_08635 [Paucimonas sp.]|nr:hypothetical protein [Paucimonas sp.]